MRVAITTDEDSLQSKVDQRFGRCNNFIILEINDSNIGAFEVIKNEGAIQGHGAGIKAAEQMGELKVDAVITGQLGPNATTVLKELGIKVYSASGVITDVLNNFISEKLNLITEIGAAHPELSKPSEKSTEKIFFPLMDNNDLNSIISQHFGHAPFFGLFDVSKKELKIIENKLNHSDPNKSPIDQIQEAVNPTTIFAKSIGGRAIQIIKQKGLGLKTGDFETVKEVVDNLNNLNDQLESCGQVH